MKIARMKITPEFMADFLELPDGSNIVGAKMDERGLIELVVEHADFRDIPRGEPVPMVEPQYSRPCPHVPATFMSWGVK